MAICAHKRNIIKGIKNIEYRIGVGKTQLALKEIILLHFYSQRLLFYPLQIFKFCNTSYGLDSVRFRGTKLNAYCNIKS